MSARPEPRIAVPAVWLALSWPLAIAVAVASIAGVLAPATYAGETASWGGQGIGQDTVNLLLAVPLLLASASRARRGSVRAFLIWQGVLLYLAYSYVLYAFFVHFGRLFPVYVAALGLSFHTLTGSILATAATVISAPIAHARAARNMAVLLAASGIVFAMLWIADIARAIALGTVPTSVTEVGLPINPVHVLDLAVLLPALIIVAWLIARGNPYGFAFAVPLATFMMTMGVAIVAMVVVMRARGVSAPLAMPIVITGFVIAAFSMTRDFLRALEL